jgi:DNA-binding MarR family transcriptional regulator
MDYEKVAAEFIDMRMPNGHSHRPFAKYQLFTKGERFALHHLMYNSGTATPGDIAKVTQTSSARVATILNSLESKGYVERKADPRDRRRVLITVTDAGHDIITKEREELVRMIASILRQMGERDTKEFVRLFHEFFSNMSECKCMNDGEEFH